MADSPVGLTLRLAEEHPNAALDEINSGRLNFAVFHIQQAIEKSLKALLLSRNLDVRTHKLSALVSLAGIDLDDELLLSLAEIEREYTRSRYYTPGFNPLTDYRIEDVSRWYEAAKRVYSTVVSML
ncbi:HEPN domain-containing protein [Thermococcus indicus]|uniref:HEPN domain-containing protein n=1 Tax=Thermococcus indicus TaxID=2586643 RepID=A0A4Y5SJI5_9EURY|nr:HEPN domain-containing protein [Thermococcus indicus]QDA31087.1 HEPN domain-containing protein [Thermococcus indicus]